MWLHAVERRRIDPFLIREFLFYRVMASKAEVANTSNVGLNLRLFRTFLVRYCAFLTDA